SRCLVPADAFYEWQKIRVTGEVRGKEKVIDQKQPWCIRRKDDETIMFAGLFSVWKNPKGEEMPTFTIITTEPNSVMSPIHNRMPVILNEKDYEAWTDRSFHDTEKLHNLLKPYPATRTDAFRVSTYVSNSRNDGPECMKPMKK
ncbi:MAG TPA: SOS response-associated peptidase, partial [Bacteroidota bacterium]|nr:SOS response-associated peptidase [Bacteroidota bacterium]